MPKRRSSVLENGKLIVTYAAGDVASGGHYRNRGWTKAARMSPEEFLADREQTKALSRFNDLGAELDRDAHGRLTGIYFDHTDVTDDDLALLKHFPNLVNLWLWDTRITDVGLDHLADLNLEFLDLVQTDVTGSGFDKFRRASPKCKIKG